MALWCSQLFATSCALTGAVRFGSHLHYDLLLGTHTQLADLSLSHLCPLLSVIQLMLDFSEPCHVAAHVLLLVATYGHASQWIKHYCCMYSTIKLMRHEAVNCVTVSFFKVSSLFGKWTLTASKACLL